MAEQQNQTQTQDEIVYEKVLQIKRLTKVTTGGKKLSFSALVVVGNGKGKVGYALGKANEVIDAIKKGLQKAKNNMVWIPVKGHTIPHDVIGEFGASKVVMKPASRGTGIIAGEVVRSLCEAAGIQDILTKSLKSNTPVNLLKAAMAGFGKLKMSMPPQLTDDEKVEGKGE